MALKARYPPVDYTKDNPKTWNCNASQKVRDYITGRKQDPIGKMYKWWIPWGQVYDWWKSSADKDEAQNRITEEELVLIMAKACGKGGKGLCFYQFMEATWNRPNDLLFVRASGPSWNGGKQPLYRVNHDGTFFWTKQ